MAITYFGSASTPADNGDAAAPTQAVTPPANMVEGDLVILIGHLRASTGTPSVLETGGQAWTELGNGGTTNCRERWAWARFNGSWSADPSLTVSGSTSPLQVIMHVFRPSVSTNVWALDQNLNAATYSAPTTPFTVTVTGATNTKDSTVTLASWYSIDDNTWDSLAGTGWVNTGDAQYRNTNGSDQSCTFAHLIMTSAGATGNVSKNQATLGGDAGLTHLRSFYEADGSLVNVYSNLTMLGAG